MITIYQPNIEKEGHFSKLITKVKIDDEIHEVYVAVDNEFEQYLVVERNDAMLLALLPYAIRKHQDITCEAPISEELLYNINVRLLPTLKKGDRRVYVPKLNCSEVSEQLKNEGIVATGISCGVDSFYTVCTHLDLPEKGYNLTALAIFNTGSFNAIYRNTGIEFVKDQVWQRAEKVASELKLPLVKVDSNISIEIPQNHYFTHTYTDAFAIHSLGKLWSKYYYASAHFAGEVSFENNLTDECSLYEQLLLDCFSTNGLSLILDGDQGTRNDKVYKISKFNLAKKYLHVCTSSDINCGMCEKCRRTMLSAEAEGVLDEFKNVFPVDYYKSHLDQYHGFLCKQIALENEMYLYKETFDKLYSKNAETFDNYLKKYTLKNIERENVRLGDYLNRWRKYGSIYRKLIDKNLFNNRLKSYLAENNINSIAFYGDGEMRRFIEEMFINCKCNINYIIEDNEVIDIKYPRYSRRKEYFNDVDLVIVTDVFATDKTFNKINRTNRNVISAENLLLELSGVRSI